MTFKTIITDIKTLKIQGAEAVAKEAVKALGLVSDKSKAKTKNAFVSELNKACLILRHTRSTEPAMRNALDYVLYNLGSSDVCTLKKQIKFKVHKVLSHFKESQNLIAEYGSRLIKKGSMVYTHCHSSTVINIIKSAYDSRDFFVSNTETRPLFQGRKTASELAALKIPVFHYVDSAARLALKNADIMFLGADAITSTGKVINKIGSELIAEAAERYQVPLYVCTDSWKYDPKTTYGHDEPIEHRNKAEVWSKAPKNVTVINPAFEVINPNLITGIISELGIYAPEVFVQGAREKYDFMR